MDKHQLSERDICTKFITPAIVQAGWQQHQFREEVNLTDGRVMVRGKLAARVKNPDAKGGPKRADFVLYGRPNVPIAVVEAKQAKFSVGHGMQQALAYAEMLDAPFAISSNGDGFLLHDRTGLTQPIERELSLTEFPTLNDLWTLYQQWKGLADASALKLVEQPFYSDGSGKEPRYYQRVAINRAIEAIAKGQQRVLLVMATGTGKTYTAFQIIWRLWKAKAKKRILFLADRNILVDQTMQQDFAPFGEVMHKVINREVKKNYEIYLALYQAVTGREEWKQIYRQFPADFFDMVVIDECHRGSAADDSAWRDVLEYFSSATHLGLTATPKETKDVSNITYFGDPVYTYSLKQGVEDGFLAPYKVIRIATDVDAVGYTPEKGKVDKLGQTVEQRQYNTKDFDRNLVLEKRTKLVASKVWEYLKATDPMAKTIVFCDDQDHAERMRQELVKLIPAAASNRRYVMRITGDDNEGKAQLSYFIDNDEPYPVIATTSKLLTTGVDAKTCKLIVLDQNINSMTEFKQIIGRGTRLREDYQKLYFTIMDFKGATRLFADPDFDGEPVVIYEPKPDDPVVPPEITDVPGAGEPEPPPYGPGSSGGDDTPPGGDMVLDLAIQGRLTLSHQSKESTLGLLDEIRSWRANQTQSKKGRRATFEVTVSDLDKPFSIPDHWIWVRNSDIFSLAKGKNPKDLGSEGKYPYLDIEALDRGNIQRYTNDEHAPRTTKADILVVCDGSRSGLVLDGKDGVIGSTLARIDTFPAIQPFVKLLFLHGYRRLNGEKKGAAIPHLDTARLLVSPCGLPPVSDQKSIIAKVDELMALCDKLEAQQQARRKLQNALRQSTLQAVVSATSPYELQTTWVRLADNFGRLFHAPEDVVAFKGLILDLAVSGELLNVEHPHPATGTALLEAIASQRIKWSQESEGQEKKEALAMLKKLRTQQVPIPDTALPEHWAWASLLQVSQAVVDCHNKTAPYVSEGIHLIRTTDIRNGRMDLSSTRKISEETFAYWARRMPPKGGDIFFTREAPMGEAAIVPEGERVCLGQRSMLIRLFPALFSNQFLLYVIQSPSFQIRMTEAAIGMTVKHLRVGGVEDLVVPVPPKAEQDQIVAIVDALFSMCDLYADQLARKQRIATNLAASAVSSLTGIAIEQEEEPMKAPQTELIAPLRLGTAPDIKAQAPLAAILARQNGEMSAKDLWQRFGGEIDAFYAQLKTEVAHGWILEPAPAEMREKPVDAVSA